MERRLGGKEISKVIGAAQREEGGDKAALDKHKRGRWALSNEQRTDS